MAIQAFQGDYRSHVVTKMFRLMMLQYLCTYIGEIPRQFSAKYGG
jgi:hypothetical protein